MEVAACGARAVPRRVVRARTGAPPNVARCESEAAWDAMTSCVTLGSSAAARATRDVVLSPVHVRQRQYAHAVRDVLHASRGADGARALRRVAGAACGAEAGGRAPPARHPDVGHTPSVPLSRHGEQGACTTRGFDGCLTVRWRHVTLTRPTQVTHLVTDKATSIIHTVSGGVFALTGAALGALVGAVVGRGSEGGMARGASLGAVAGAVVFIEALNATRGLLSPPDHWVRSRTVSLIPCHCCRVESWALIRRNVHGCVRVQTGNAQRSTALDLQQLRTEIRAATGPNSSSLPTLLIQARRHPHLPITTMPSFVFSCVLNSQLKSPKNSLLGSTNIREKASSWERVAAVAWSDNAKGGDSDMVVLLV